MAQLMHLTLRDPSVGWKRHESVMNSIMCRGPALGKRESHEGRSHASSTSQIKLVAHPVGKNESRPSREENSEKRDSFYLPTKRKLVLRLRTSYPAMHQLAQCSRSPSTKPAASRPTPVTTPHAWSKPVTGLPFAVSAIKTPTPTALPICRLMFSTALPVVARSGGRVPAVTNIGACDRPPDMPSITRAGNISDQYAG